MGVGTLITTVFVPPLDAVWVAVVVSLPLQVDIKVVDGVGISITTVPVPPAVAVFVRLLVTVPV
jgi:hypothetical protein